MNKKFFLTLFILILSSCLRINELELFQAIAFNRVSASKKISELNPHYLNGKEILAPPFTWQSLILFETDKEKICLLYRIPFRSGQIKKTGILKFVTINKGQTKCNQTFNNNSITSLKISNLKVSILNNIRLNNIADKTILIRADLQENKREFTISIPLINIKKKNKYKKFRSFQKNLEIELFPSS